MNQNTYVAIDLGSNSFHLLIARDDHGALQVIDKIKVMVQLAAGLDKKNRLDDQTKTRALSTLARFGERIKGIENAKIRAIGTSTLRRARDNDGFIETAELMLGVPIEIISGAEEARLIYKGVCSSLPQDTRHRFVMDIGGGSTEFIIGKDKTPLQLDSISMGCIRYSQKYGELPLKKAKIKAAINKVEQNLQDIKPTLEKLGWAEAIGASGSIKAASRACAKVFGTNIISKSNVEKLLDLLSSDDMSIERLCERLEFELPRATVFSGGLLILYGTMKALNIDTIRTSDHAIREGVIWELIGREVAEDIRHQTVIAVSHRFSINTAQGASVNHVAQHLFAQVRDKLGNDFDGENLLRWASELHEIGLAISHNNHHKHGAYLVSQMDMAGFSTTVQTQLARLIRLQRKRLDSGIIEPVNKKSLVTFCSLILITRLAVLLCRSQQMQNTAGTLPNIHLNTGDANSKQVGYLLTVSKKWITEHPLTAFDLDEEVSHWQEADDFPLSFAWQASETA